MDWVLRTGANAEWVEGEIIMMAPSGPEQQDLNWWLCTLVRHYVDYKDLGIVLMDTFTRLTVPRQQVRAPDVLFVQKSRANIVVGNKAIGGAPDLIMEVVSHDSQARDWREKYHDYEAAGVREYWIIDPATQARETYALSAQGRYQRLAEQDGRLVSTVIPGWFLRPEWMWRDPRPSVLQLLPELGIRLG
jgi:Uma2 family endonuclease